MLRNPSRAGEERERIILEHLPQVQIIARRYERIPGVTLDDLMSAGTIGLIQAIDHFDPSRNVKLKTYAEHKIRGAILDSVRKRYVSGDKPVELAFEPLDERCNLIADPGESPLRQYERREAIAMLSRALGELPERDRTVALLFYCEGRKHREIAAMLHVGTSRVQQLKVRAIERLQAAIG